MRIGLTLGGRSDGPHAPAEIADEVEKYAREHGRTGKIEFARGPNVWLVKLSLKPNDPRMLRYQQGLAPEPPVETVWLQEPTPLAGRIVNGQVQGPNRALDIHQLGAAGVRAFLERGNTWSGRGEHGSLEGAFQAAAANNDTADQKNRARSREDAVLGARDDRRHYQNVQRITPGIDLTTRIAES